MIEDGVSDLIFFFFYHLLNDVKVLCPLSSSFYCQHVSR